MLQAICNRRAFLLALAIAFPHLGRAAAGDECVVSKPLVLTEHANGKGSKLKVAQGSRLRIVAVERNVARVSADGQNGYLPMSRLTGSCAGASTSEPELITSRPAQAAVPSEAPAPKTAESSPLPSGAADAAAQEAVAEHAAVTGAIGAQSRTAPVTVSATAPGRARRLAVYDLKLDGVDPGTGALVTESLLAEVRKLQGISAIGMDEVRDMLAFERTKDVTGCDEVTCLAEIGGALGVDDLITGRLSRAGGGHAMLLRRIDQSHAQTLATYNERLQAGNGEEFLAAVGPAVEQLFPSQPLRPGAMRGVADEVALRLHPPPLPAWSFWTVSAGALAAGAAAGVFAILTRNAESRYSQQMSLATTQEVPARSVSAIGQEATNDARDLNYSLLGAGALAISAAVTALFTDWHGH